MSEARLIIADSDRDANMFYATKFLAPDPFVFLQVDGKKMVLLSDLELDRGKTQAKVDEVLSLTKLTEAAKRRGVERPTLVDLIDGLLRDVQVNSLLVPGNFPVQYADPLRERRYTIRAKRDPFFEERAVKTPEEIEAITRTQRATEAALEQAIEAIRRSTVQGGMLSVDGQPLTSERIKQIINVHLMEQGCVAEHTIVACGKDGVDPHHQGSGPFRANESIIMDIFPRSSESRYYADLTRTVVKGRASDKLKRMYQAVQEGQEIAFRTLKEGVDGSTVHNAIMQHFEKLGFKTGEQDGRIQGFFHGTGHGVGLDIHEPPRVNPSPDVMKAGYVVTVEPGLYYLDAGGVRLEDMVVITKSGMVNLTKAPRVLEV